MKDKFLYIIFFNSIVVFGQTNITIGVKAPEIEVTDWIYNIPNDKSVDNRFVVLDFWATWCGHCIDEFSFLDSLKSEAISKDVLFLSITDERPEKIKKVINRLTIDVKTSIVTDTNGVTQERYGNGQKITILPLVVLIDNKGIIKWKGSKLDKQTYYDFLLDDLPVIQKRNDIYLPDNSFGYLQSDSLVNFLKIDSSKANSFKTEKYKRKGTANAKFIAFNCDLKRCLVSLLDYDPKFIEVSESIEGLY
ncbi:TlpA family protein disulfide reductase, partial [Flavobacterium sp. NRK F10]|uniref:TlpA family protein disulfide reductase n=1 Tax=Flavobacterium sp. NRK F10 TaxID=2954931 RepID=UPI0020917802